MRHVGAWLGRQARRLAAGLLRRLVRGSTIGLKTGAHVTRFQYYQHLANYRTTPSPESRAVAISGSERLAGIFGYPDSQVVSINYPESDLLSLKFADNTFDTLFADQVLEHVAGDPFTAFAESFRVVKPGGLVVHATVFIYPMHNNPVDCWRFSPYGLRLLAEPHGEIIDAGGWGHFWLWPYVRLGLLNIPIPYARWHPLHKFAVHNDPLWPCVTWVIARKR
jgi:SAM-dependent methyltransferase